VQGVHPLRFLGTIFSSSYLKKCMVGVKDSYFTWKCFMNGQGNTPGFLKKCEREYKNSNMLPYVVSFCQIVKAHPDQVRSLIEKREFEKLVEYLVKLDNGL
ncbi:MAG: hypothetical protein ACRENF_02730, partial [Thermodesulfobacteriota bacterium]